MKDWIRDKVWNWLKKIKDFCLRNQNLKIKFSLFIAGKFVDEGFLLSFNFLQAFEFNGISIKFCFFLIKIIVEFHHFLFSVLRFALTFVSFTKSSEFLFFDFDSILIETLVERVHNLIKRDDFGNELHGETFKLVWFTILFRLKDSNVVILIEGNWGCGGHGSNKEFKIVLLFEKVW